MLRPILLLFPLFLQAQPQTPNLDAALLNAASQCNLNVMKSLLEQGANVNAQDINGQTVLMKAGCYLANEGKLWELIALYVPNLELKDKDGNTALRKAASIYNVETVRLLLKIGADVHTRNAKGESVLHNIPFGERGKENLKVLLDAGADPNAQNTNGDTPLHYFASLAWPHSTECEVYIGILLQAGARTNQVDDHGYTPLSVAAAAGNQAALRLLLAAGASVAVRDTNGNSPLTFSVFNNQLYIAHRLFKAGAKVEEAYQGDWNALSAAIKSNQPSAWEEVLKGDAAEATKGKAGMSKAWSWMAFGVAAMKGDIRFFEACRNGGIPLPTPEGFESIRWTHIHPLLLMAASFGRIELLDYFLRTGAIPFPMTDEMHFRLGGILVEKTTEEHFSRFLEWEDRHPPFAADPVDMAVTAARCGQTAMLEILFKQRKKQLHLNDDLAAGLLNGAASESHWDTVRFLLKSGPIPTILPKTEEGESFWDQALQQDLSANEIADLILINPRITRLPCKKSGQILWAEPILQSPKVVKRLLEGGLSADGFLKPAVAKDENPLIQGKAHPEVTAMVLGKVRTGLDDLGPDELPLVAKAGSPLVLQCLLDQGVKVNWRDKNGRHCYLLHHLLDNAENGSELALAFLRRPESTVQIALKDGLGRLPLGLIAKLRPIGPECGTGYNPTAHLAKIQSVASQIIALLLKAGALPDAPDSMGLTPLEVAAGGPLEAHSRGSHAIFCALQGCVLPLRPDLKRKAIASALRGKNTETLAFLLSDRTSLDPTWPWAEWMESLIDYYFYSSDQVLLRGLVDVGFVPRSRRLDIYWRRVRDFTAKQLANALDLGSLKPDVSGLALLEAAQKGDEADIQAALNRTTIDVRDESGRTPLMEAAEAGYIGAVRLLLNAGANPNVHAVNQEGPLHMAFRAGHDDIAKILICEGKANPDQTGVKWMPPLISAILDRNHTRAHFLLKHGVNLQSECYQTVATAPLNAAALVGDLEMLQFLVGQCGLDPKESPNFADPRCKIECECDFGRPLRDEDFQGSFERSFETPLVTALKANNPKIVAWLLSQGVRGFGGKPGKELGTQK